MRDLEFHRETFDSFYPDCLPLLEAHNAAMEEGEPLQIAEEVYRESENTGGLRIYAARSENGELAAYVAFLILRDIHHGRLEAWADAFFVNPEFAGCGRALVGYAERELFAEDVQMVFHEVRPSHGEFAQLLKHLDYLPVSQIFGKRVN